MKNLVVFIPLIPLLAASYIGVLHLFSVLDGEKVNESPPEWQIMQLDFLVCWL